MKEAGLTPVFHPWKLHLALSDPFPGQVLEPGPTIIVRDNDHDEWKVLKVVDSQKTKRYGIQYKATYMGIWDKWNPPHRGNHTAILRTPKKRYMGFIGLTHESQDQRAS